MVNAIKANSSRWIRENHCKGFRWQKGYGAFSMNLKNESHLKKYINNQERIHRSRAAREEMARFARATAFISPMKCSTNNSDGRN